MMGWAPKTITWDAGNAWQSFVGSCMRLIGAVEEQKIGSFRVDWVLNQIDLVEAKFGGLVPIPQFQGFLNDCVQRGGSLTYICAFYPPQGPIMAQLAANAGVTFRIISIL
jgi:hypothetical protein